MKTLLRDRGKGGHPVPYRQTGAVRRIGRHSWCRASTAYRASHPTGLSRPLGRRGQSRRQGRNWYWWPSLPFPAEQLFEVTDSPCQSSVNTNGTNGAAFETRPLTERLWLTIDRGRSVFGGNNFRMARAGQNWTYVHEKLQRRAARINGQHRRKITAASVFLLWRGSLASVWYRTDRVQGSDGIVDERERDAASVITLPVDDSGTCIARLARTSRTSEMSRPYCCAGGRFRHPYRWAGRSATTERIAQECFCVKGLAKPKSRD
jgi:hypothetical protein